MARKVTENTLHEKRGTGGAASEDDTNEADGVESDFDDGVHNWGFVVAGLRSRKANEIRQTFFACRRKAAA